MEHLKLYIGGKWVDGHSGAVIEVENPATKEIIATVPRGDKIDVEAAVNAAKEGFNVWKNYTGVQRGACLRKAAEYFKKNSKKIADIITAELGAPISMAEDWHVGGAYGETIEFAEFAEQ